MENNEEVILASFIGYMKFKSQFSALSKKSEIALENGFRLSEIVKLTTKSD